jgi:hypothetical protein
MNRKANVLDALPIMSGIIVFGIMIVIALLFLNSLNSAIQSSDVGSTAKQILQTGADDFPAMFDFWFAIMFIGLPAISGVLAYFNNIHPAFFWLSLTLAIAIVFIGKAFQLIWQAFVSDATIASVAQTLPIANLVLSNYGLYSFFIFIIIASGTFIKLRGGVRADIYGGL